MAVTSLQPGLHAELTRTVSEADTAAALGSGDLDVLGTPRLLAWLEAATCTAVQVALGDAESTVGTRAGIEHLKASAVGATVTVAATLTHVDGRLLRFEVAATDADGVMVGHGEITRVVVDRERFLARLTPR
jgi:predicted thioesterase